jgi:hypothetical protein
VIAFMQIEETVKRRTKRTRMAAAAASRRTGEW